jgi:hypothetical protein
VGKQIKKRDDPQLAAMLAVDEPPKCSVCGAVLGPEWMGTHTVPFAFTVEELKRKGVVFYCPEHLRTVRGPKY